MFPPKKKKKYSAGVYMKTDFSIRKGKRSLSFQAWHWYSCFRELLEGDREHRILYKKWMERKKRMSRKASDVVITSRSKAAHREAPKADTPHTVINLFSDGQMTSAWYDELRLEKKNELGFWTIISALLFPAAESGFNCKTRIQLPHVTPVLFFYTATCLEWLRRLEAKVAMLMDGQLSTCPLTTTTTTTPTPPSASLSLEYYLDLSNAWLVTWPELLALYKFKFVLWF